MILQINNLINTIINKPLKTFRMKKIFLSLALAISMMASAQVFEVGQLTKLNTPTDTDVKVAGVSADGSYVLITNGSNHGLRRYDVATGKTTTISTAAGAGYNVQISKDGQELVYRETSFDAQGLRRSDIIRLDLTTSKTATIAKGQRDMIAMANTGASVSVSINDRKIVLTKNGKNIVLAPNGSQESYIWPSVSPDGTKLCYYVCGNGCWVANLDGSGKQYIGHGVQAAKWYDNNTLVAMDADDDGHYITASAIVAYTLDGKKQLLTNSSMVAMYPDVAENMIVFSTLDGETYMLNVK
jgi:Tol biopolymer transport system component